MTSTISNEDLRLLLAAQGTPCVSLYQPTMRAFPARQQNQVRFKNLLRELDQRVSERADPAAKEALLAPLRNLADDADFWAHPQDGLAVLCSPELFRVYWLQRPVPELVVVSESLHLKPLLRITQSADRFRILCLDRNKVRLFEGNRDVLDEIDLPSGVPHTMEEALGTQLTDKDQSGFTHGFGPAPGAAGDAMRHGPAEKDVGIDKDRDRFFLMVDQGLLRDNLGSAGLPLVLAALPENQGHFRSLSQNPQILPEGIDVNPMGLDAETLKARAWQILLPHYEERLEKLIDEYREAQAKAVGTDELERAGEAGACSRIRTLLVDADRHVKGRLDRETGKTERLPDNAPDADDLLDDLMEFTLQRGGEVVVVPAGRMPTKSGIAAIYRY